jgi:hypothetical protein
MLDCRVKSFGVLGLLVACLVGSGCGSKSTEPLSPTQQALQKIGAAYTRGSQRLNHPPANRDELLSVLQMMQMNADVLRSPNDGEEFVIVWGVELRNQKMKPDERPVIAFEKVGKDGKRFVLRGTGDIQEMTDSQLKGCTLPPDYKLPF